jgi:transposase-like protein
LPEGPLIKVVRCPYCGYQNSNAAPWMRGHKYFQCAGCGEQFRLREKKIKKVLVAVAKAFDDLWRKL